MAATFASDGAYVLNTGAGAGLGINSRPAMPGDGIIAYGIGFGDVNPSILPGVSSEPPPSAASDPNITLTPKGWEMDDRRLSAANAAGHPHSAAQLQSPERHNKFTPIRG
jgi:hypothetical protein